MSKPTPKGAAAAAASICVLCGVVVTDLPSGRHRCGKPCATDSSGGQRIPLSPNFDLAPVASGGTIINYRPVLTQRD